MGETRLQKYLGPSLAFTTLIALYCVASPLAIAQQSGNPGPQGAERKLRHYTVTDLGTLGGTFGIAHGINNRDQVNGYANLPGDTTHHAFFWQNGVKTDIGTLGGPNSDSSFGPSERGQVAGGAETPEPNPNGNVSCFTDHICRAYLWQNGVMTDLGTLGGNNSYANGINNQGQVAGWSENNTPDPTCPPTFAGANQTPPVLWDTAEMDGEEINGGPKPEIHQLPTFPGEPDGFALSVNDKGQAVGYTGNCTTGFHAVLWGTGTITDLGNLGGTMNNWALNLNNRGQVVGFSDLAGDATNHAFLWQNGVMTDLGTLPGDFSSFAGGINNKGQVVGGSCDVNGNCRAFLWQNGTMTDLNTLIPAHSPLILLTAPDINSRGEIVGQAYQSSSGEIHAFLATPTTDDSSDAAAASSRPIKVTLPENVRQCLQQQMGFSRFRSRLVRPR